MWPLVRAHAQFHRGLNVLLHLDAHPDLYDAFNSNRYSHACPFARSMVWDQLDANAPGMRHLR
ncbi:MAG: arginase family protein [Acidobacteriota bacterium]|jgi:arginase family enzyme|nr:arginase family protein [Acidobacteriota bacterium]